MDRAPANLPAYRDKFLLICKQIVRYAGIGIALNGIGYGIYLVLTALGVPPLLTIAIFYPVGVLAGYVAHGRYTFNGRRHDLKASAPTRYVVVYIASFLINAGLLYAMPKYLGLPHQLTQLFAIFICAAFLFVALKLFVFHRRV